YWSHDIGGFERQSTADVYKRWCAFGLLSSHSRLHGSDSYRVPWQYDEEAVDVLRFFTHLKARLMPYLYRNAIETSRTGIPMMRSMALEFPQDRNCAYLCSQYMLGDSLLVAPIFNDQSLAEYYLPEGTWTNVLTGEVREGNRWYKEKHGYMSIPLYAREASIITMGAKEDGVLYDYAQDAEYHVYGLREGCTASTCVYGMDNTLCAELRVHRTQEGYRIAYTGQKPCKVIIGSGSASLSAQLTQTCEVMLHEN
ncbi:MAG: TIM-barrel domain-containing protein, partial [Aristaeellaceae bacterium]